MEARRAQANEEMKAMMQEQSKELQKMRQNFAKSLAETARDWDDEDAADGDEKKLAAIKAARKAEQEKKLKKRHAVNDRLRALLNKNKHDNDKKDKKEKHVSMAQTSTSKVAPVQVGPVPLPLPPPPPLPDRSQCPEFGACNCFCPCRA